MNKFVLFVIFVFLFSLVPVYGDVASVGVKSAKVVDVALTVGKQLDAIKFITKNASLNDLEKITALDSYFKQLKGIPNDVASDLVAKGIAKEDVIKVAENGADLSDTLEVGKNSFTNMVMWLQNGTSTWGFTHIINGHYSDFVNAFGVSNSSQVKLMIKEVLDTGSVYKYVPGDYYQYTKKFIDKNNSLKEVSVIVSDKANGVGKGNVVTAHPGV